MKQINFLLANVQIQKNINRTQQRKIAKCLAYHNESSELFTFQKIISEITLN
jgi:hypothetical protein